MKPSSPKHSSPHSPVTNGKVTNGDAQATDQPTAPRPRDAQGRELDKWGLPRSGPARVARLQAMKLADPELDPSGWTAAADAPSAAASPSGADADTVKD